MLATHFKQHICEHGEDMPEIGKRMPLVDGTVKIHGTTK
jgi:hypothetical protein